MSSMGDQKSPWISRPAKNDRAQLRLFCFPYSGAAASIFYPWIKRLPDAIEVCPVQLPGRSTRLGEPLYKRLEPLVQSVAEALVPFMALPFAFFGHSLGALISFELARTLRQLYGVSPLYLIVSAHQAPHMNTEEPKIHNLPDDEFLEKINQLNGMGDEILGNSELMEIFLPILRADFEICETYTFTPGDPLACPISAYGGLADRYVHRQHLQAWGEHTRAAFVTKMFPGDHFYLHAHRSMLLQSIAQDLYPYLRDLTAGDGS